jgi:hypothetical protein
MLLAGILWARPESVTAYSAKPLAADRLDLAGAFQADDGAGAADPAVRLAGRDREIGAVERRRPHLDQDLVGLGRGLWGVGVLDALLGDDGSLHGNLPGSEVPHSTARCLWG